MPLIPAEAGKARVRGQLLSRNTTKTKRFSCLGLGAGTTSVHHLALPIFFHLDVLPKPYHMGSLLIVAPKAQFRPCNPSAVLLVLRKQQFSPLGPILTSTLRELAWELRLALVSAIGPPNIWAKSCMKAWLGIRMPTSCKAREGSVRKASGACRRLSQITGKATMTHRGKGVQVFVELPRALHHQGHWSWQQVLQELLGYPHLAVPGGKRAQTHSRSPGWTSTGLKADAGKGSCTMRSTCPPTSSELWHKAERQRSIPGLKSTRLSRRQCPQRRDITLDRSSNYFILILSNCGGDSFFPRDSPSYITRAPREQCHARPVVRRDQRAVDCGAWHALSAPNTFPVPDSLVSQDKPLPRTAPQSPKPVTGNPSRGAASSGAGSGRPHL